MQTIAPTATISTTADIADDVIIGPGCVIEDGVVIGAGSILKANVYVCQNVEIGQDNLIYQNVVLGETAQSIGEKDDNPFKLVIGNHNIIRENVTIHRGSSHGGGITTIGHHCFIMTNVHIGHDCEIDNHVILSSGVIIGGHVKLHERVWLSAMVGVNPFVTVGKFVYGGALSIIAHDIPHFVKVAGSYPCKIRGFNSIGLERNGYTTEVVAAIKYAYKQLYRSKAHKTILMEVKFLREQTDLNGETESMLEMIEQSASHRTGRYLESKRH